MNSMKVIISSLLILCLIIVTITGIGLYLAPSGRFATETNWSFIGINKIKLEKIHTMLGFIMSILIIIHLFLNYKLFLAELRRFKK